MIAPAISTGPIGGVEKCEPTTTVNGFSFNRFAANKLSSVCTP